MGVLGLWQLIESSGRPVPLETLENKVLAIGLFTKLFMQFYEISKNANFRYIYLAASSC